MAEQRQSLRLQHETGRGPRVNTLGQGAEPICLCRTPKSKSWAYSKMEPVEPGINAIDPYFYITEITGSPSDGVLIFPALSFVKATAEKLKRKIEDGTLETELKQRFDDMPDYWFPSKQLGFHESKGGIVR